MEADVKAMIILALATVGCCLCFGKLGFIRFQQLEKHLDGRNYLLGSLSSQSFGNAAEHASAIMMAYKNKMDVAVEIAIGSTIQVAMFVAPVLVLLSLLFETSMPLVFTWPELISMVTAVLLMITIILMENRIGLKVWCY